MQLLLRFLFCSVFFFCLSATIATDWKTIDLGSCSIELPSNWHVHDKETRESFGSYNNDPTKKRLLASQDKSDQNNISMIVRVNTLPSNEEQYEDIKNVTKSDLEEMTELLRKEYSRYGNLIKKVFPVQKMSIDGMPAILISYLRHGKRGSEWRVRICQIITKNKMYQVTLSMNTRFPENEKILKKIFSSFKFAK